LTTELLIAMGIPSAITGLLVWWLKKYIDKREARAEEHDKNLETLMMMVIQTSKANNVLAVATAHAVQRIPDAQCNGDMTAALEKASRIQQEEKDFLMKQGIKHIFTE
jgi:type II secretory pathway pseudopilin PulG